MALVCGQCYTPHTVAEAARRGGGTLQTAGISTPLCSNACYQKLGALLGAGTKRSSEEPPPVKGERVTPLIELYESVKPRLATYGNGVTLAPSTLMIGEPPRPAGLGVFATRRFAAGEPITEFTGFLISHATGMAMTRDERSHVRALFSFTNALDGKRFPNGRVIANPLTDLVGMGIGAYSNDARNSPFTNNAKFDWADDEQTTNALNSGRFEVARNGRRVLFLRAIDDIEPGDEVFVGYGDDYWTNDEERQSRLRRWW